MCGRTKLTVPFATLAKLYRLEETDAPLLVPRQNIAPTQTIAVVRADASGVRRLALLRWGLVPAWAKAMDGKLFNARSESLATKPAFRAAFRKRRCLVLADGFYEWKAEGKRKQPHLVTAPGGEPFAMAGLWEAWTSSDGEIVETCTIVTREAAGPLEGIHTRMPVVLSPECHEAWLDPAVSDPAALEALLATAIRDALVVAPIDKLPSDAPAQTSAAAANDSTPDAPPPPRQLKLFG